MNYTGMDLAGKSSALCIMTKDGHILSEFEVSTTPEDIRKALDPRRVGLLRVALEACGISHWVSDVVEKLGHEVVVIDPRSCKAITASKRKNDRLDARTLGHVLRSNFYTETYRKGEQSRLWRAELAVRGNLVSMRTGLGNQVRGILRSWNVKVPGTGWGRYQERALSGDMPECLLSLLAPLLDLIGILTEKIKEMDRSLKIKAQKNEAARLLMTAPGVGPVTALSYLATLEDPSRFKKSRQVGSYLGLVPSLYQSGETCHHGRITKHGDAMLRTYLVEAAHVILSHTKKWSWLKAWGLRIAKRSGPQKARVAVARRLAVVLHRMWVTQRPFEYSRVQ
jgi:transposase